MVIEKLKDRLIEERKDVIAYEELAHIAKEEGEKSLSKYLYAIARDEKKHQVFLHNYIKDYDSRVK